MARVNRAGLGRLGRSVRYQPGPKASRTYTVKEVAEICGAKKHDTIRRWIAAGLPVLDTRRPTLIRGADLVAFLAKRKADRKRPCPSGTMFCFSCKTPRQPAFGLVEFHPGAGPTGRLIGLCPVCSTELNRCCLRERVPDVMPGIDVQFVTPSPRLEACTDADEERMFDGRGSDDEI